MVLTYGDVSSFGNLKWYYLELRSEHTIESTLRRLGSNLKSIFQDSAVEIFIPIEKRDLNVCTLNTINCVYVRSQSFPKLLRLKSVTGVVGLLTKGDSNRPADALSLSNDFVQAEILKAEDAFIARPIGIQEGTFVRILDGEYRDWCGTVMAIDGDRAAVKVDIRTKIITIETPIRNLINKDHVPAELRVFYYGDQVELLGSLGLAFLVADDLEYKEDAPEVDDGLTAPPPKKLGRHQTVTSLVKRQITKGVTDPSTIATLVLAALKAGRLKRPKNLSIVHGIIKNKLVTDHYAKLNPSLKNYRDVVNAYGDTARFTLQELTQMATEMDAQIS